MALSPKFPDQPAQVYLDSSDFSMLCDVKRDATWRHDMLGRLRHAVSAGKVVARFSAAHIFEAAPVAKEGAAPGISRLRLIGEICGSKALRYFTVLLQDELRAKQSGHSLSPTHAQSDAGEWMPGFGDLTDELNRMQSETLTLLNGMPRSVRRKFLSKRGSLILPGGREEQAKQARELTATFFGFERCLPAFRRFMEGAVDAAHVEREFLKPFLDPAEFAHVYIGNFDRLADTMAWLREIGEKNVRTFSDLRSDLWQVRPDWSDEEKSTFATKAYHELKTRWLLGSNERLIRNAVDNDRPLPSFSSVEEAAELAPSYFAYINAFATAFSRTLLPPGHPRKLKRSDAGDCLHAVYIPHVITSGATGLWPIAFAIWDGASTHSW